MHGPNLFDYVVAIGLFAASALAIVAAVALECIGPAARERRRHLREARRMPRHFVIDHPERGPFVVNPYTLTPEREALLTRKYNGRWE